MLNTRKTFPKAEREAELLSPDAAPVSTREPKDFPRHMPRHIYDQGGFFRNVVSVLWPPAIPSAKPKPVAQAAAEPHVSVDNTTATETTAATAKTQKKKKNE